MDDKTLFQNLINEIKNLNARGIADSKVLRDSLAQDIIISDGIKDLNKNISALDKKIKESSEKVEEHLYYTHLNSEHIEYNTKMAGLDISDIKKTIKDKFNSSEENNIDISLLDNIENLIRIIPTLTLSIGKLSTTLFDSQQIYNKLAGSVNTLSNNITSLTIQSAGAPAAPPVSGQTQQTTAPAAPPVSNTTTSPLPISISSPLLPSNNALNDDLVRTQTLSNIFENISKIDSFAALKASMVMPLIIKRIVSAMKNFSSVSELSEAARQTLLTFGRFFDSFKVISELKLGKLITNVYVLGKIMPLITGLFNNFALGLNNSALKKLNDIEKNNSLSSFSNLIFTLNNLSFKKLYTISKILPLVVFKITKSINIFAKNLKDATLAKLNGIGESLNPFVETLQQLGNIKLLKLAIFGRILPEIAILIGNGINSFAKNLKDATLAKLNGIGESLNPFVETLQSLANINLLKLAIFGKLLPGIANLIANGINSFAKNLKPNTIGKLNGIGESLNPFVETLQSLANIKLLKLVVLSKLLPGISQLIANGINSFAKNLKPNILKNLSKIQDSLNPFVETLQQLGNIKLLKLAIFGKLLPGIANLIGNGINSFAENLKPNILKNLSKIQDSLKPFTETLQQLGNIKILKLVVLSKLLPGISIGLTKSIDLLGSIKSNSFKKIDQLKESFIPFIDDLGKSFSKIGTSLIKMSIGVALLAGSLFIMSKIDAGNLMLVAGSTLAVAGAMFILSKINAGAALKGIGVVAASALAMSGLAYALKMFNGISLDAFLMSIGALTALTGAAVLLSKFAGQAAIGSVVILALSASLIPLAYSMKMLEGITWETLGIAASALVGLAAAAFGLSFIAPAIFVGSLAIAALGASLLPLSLSLNMLSSVDPSVLMDIATSLAAFTASVLPLVLVSPLFSLLSLALVPFTFSLFALSKVGKGLNKTSNFFEKITSFVKQVPSDEIWNISKALGALSAAMLAFAATDLGSSIASAFSGLINFFSGGNSPIEKLKEIASLTTLTDIGPAIKSLSDGLYNLSQLKKGAFEAINQFPWDKIQSIASELKEGSTLQIIHVASASDLRTSTLEETGSKMNGTGAITVNNIVSNSGGNTTNTSIANSTTNLRNSPQIIAPRSREF